VTVPGRSYLFEDKEQGAKYWSTAFSTLSAAESYVTDAESTNKYEPVLIDTAPPEDDDEEFYEYDANAVGEEEGNDVGDGGDPSMCASMSASVSMSGRGKSSMATGGRGTIGMSFFAMGSSAAAMALDGILEEEDEDNEDESGGNGATKTADGEVGLYII
jgi:hypothetical protein